jgi:hypothetical protein
MKGTAVNSLLKHYKVYWVIRLFKSFDILEIIKHDISDTASVSVLR